MTPFTSIDKTYKHLRRLQEFLAILIKYGFGDLVASSPLARLLPEEKKEQSSIFSYSRAQRLRMVLEELGPSFIKFGQVLSNRHDLLSPELIAELSHLQNQVPAVDFDSIYRIITTELGKNPEEVFAEIDRQPLAAASIAQVHRAVLREDNREVCLKIQRPGIAQSIQSDLEVMYDLARLAEQFVPDVRHLKPVELVRLFERSIKKEINFVAEAANLEQFQRNFAHYKDVHIPTLFRPYCSERLLVMELMRGTKIDQIEQLREKGLDTAWLAHLCVDLYFKQIFDYGFFHADPHPGNILVLDNGSLCFLDFGMMGHIPAKDKEAIADVLIGVSTKDAPLVVRSVLALSRQRSLPRLSELEREMQDMIDEYGARSLKDISMKEFIERLLKLIADFQIPVPTDYLLLLRALIMMEGTGKRLDPELNLLEAMAPYGQKLILQRYSMENLLLSARRSTLDIAVLLRDLPGDLRDIVAQLKEGSLRLEVEHKDLQDTNNRLDRISNRLAFALVLAAMIIGSAIISHSNLPPHWHGMPVLAIGAFALSAVLALGLLVAIFRRGI